MNNGAFGENFPYTNFHDLNLDWIIQTVKDTLKDIKNNSDSIEELEKKVAKLEEWVDSFDDTLIRDLVMNYLKKMLATMIFVEINDAGYIVYYIPDSWDEITFNTTGLDIILALQPEYGHLVLSY